MSTLPTVSVIIPTYNRQEFLRRTLASLALQEWPGDPFEVIVVDDGSSDDTTAVAAEPFPFRMRYIRQANQGDAGARNTGARQSRADVLVFLDDDVVVSSHYLYHLARAHHSLPDAVVTGTEHLWLESADPPAEATPSPAAGPDQPDMVAMPFADVCSNNMSLRREAYFAVGMMQDLGFGGSSIWCDVDFTYRAFRQGFEFRRSTQAICWHRDHVFQSLESHTRRRRESAYRAVALFQKYPELISFVPMFEDKTPIAWGHDRPALIARKAARPVTSSRFVLWSLAQLITILDQARLLPGLRRVLLRWLIGGHVHQGYRAGLRDLRMRRRPPGMPAHNKG
jgi:glycosyltransferase involved in cell wall biosynthesis